MERYNREKDRSLPDANLFVEVPNRVEGGLQWQPQPCSVFTLIIKNNYHYNIIITKEVLVY
jgi:hypothetical protein